MAGEVTKALNDMADEDARLRSELKEVREERDRFRRALARISDAESGHWGRIAHDALRGKDAA